MEDRWREGGRKKGRGEGIWKRGRIWKGRGEESEG